MLIIFISLPHLGLKSLRHFSRHALLDEFLFILFERNWLFIGREIFLNRSFYDEQVWKICWRSSLFDKLGSLLSLSKRSCMTNRQIAVGQFIGLKLLQMFTTWDENNRRFFIKYRSSFCRLVNNRSIFRPDRRRPAARFWQPKITATPRSDLPNTVVLLYTYRVY